MQFFPLFLRLSGRDCLVVGGGEIAARKVRLLRRGGAHITVVAPELCEELAALAAAGEIGHLAAEFDPAQIGGQVLIIAATSDAEVNRRVAAVGRRANVPVNVVDDAESSTAIMPAIVDRSPIVVALSSSGTAPVLARRLRERIETMLPSGYGNLARLAGAFRRDVRGRLPQAGQRLRFWEQVFEGPVASRALAGDESGARELLQGILDQAESSKSPQGLVYLVGAGPGNPDLLTLRALRCMQQADVVLYDRLIDPGILDLVRRDAERIDVGKRSNRHTLPQEDINALLLRLAREGHRVLRLKGGDPFIFGRGGEEIATLAEAGVPFEVVPGVTAASGCGAYAGIPLTHRDHAQACVFVTGHPRRDGELDLDWDALAVRNQTVVVYMTLTALERICSELAGHGLGPDWPAAVVVDGTLATQRVIEGSLGDLPERVGKEEIRGPALLIVGQVVRLRSRLGWFAT